ncbi:MAG: hypothetical protein C5B59_08320 [Bacteroidetes bacterium]|nr:MAG: hypothetical protein C5B59_08320 [Bacteroidota bacterium]
MKRFRIILIILIVQNSDKTLAQSITAKDLIGIWQMELKQGETSTGVYFFKDYDTLLNINNLHSRTDTSLYSIGTMKNESILRIMPIKLKTPTFFIWKIKMLKDHRIRISLYSSIRINENTYKWEEQKAATLEYNLIKIKSVDIPEIQKSNSTEWPNYVPY